YDADFAEFHALPRGGTRARCATDVVLAGFCLSLEYLPIADPLGRRSLANLVRNEVQPRRAMVGRGSCRRGGFVGYLDLRWHGLDESHRTLVGHRQAAGLWFLPANQVLIERPHE